MPKINLGYKKPRGKTYNKAAYQRVYQSAQWRRLREHKKQSNPLCEDCELENLTTPAQEIHHIKPFEIGNTEDEIANLAFDFDNLVSLCILHHKQRHFLLNQNQNP